MCSSTYQSPISFARHVVQQLRNNARELSKETDIKSFCSILEGALANVQQLLENLDGDQDEVIDDPRVMKLLRGCEKLCQVRLSVIRNLVVVQLITGFSGLLVPLLLQRSRHLIAQTTRPSFDYWTRDRSQRRI